MSLEELELYFGADVAKDVQLYSFIISSIIIIAMFILKAIAIKTLAKNKGLDKLYLAYIPFFNYILLGKVIGTSYLFRHKVNNIGLLVTIATLISFVMKTLLNLGYYVSVVGAYFNVTSITYNSVFVSNWMSQTGAFFTVIWYLYDVIAIIEIVLTASIIFFIFRKYAPERAFIYSLISIFFEFMFGPLLFLIRNKTASAYDNFMRSRVIVIQNPNDIGNAYNQNNVDNDPFPEFTNNKANKDENNSSDDFFN